MITVRPGTSADADGAVEVWRASTTVRAGRPPSASAIERVASYPTRAEAFFVVAEDGGDIVGMALGMQALADDGAGPPIAGRCHISMVFVAPDRWGEGIGGTVVSAILEQARRRGFIEAQLWTHENNVRALRLYERHGFIRSGRAKDDEDGDRIVHLERPLGG